jgi:hypothetical protein
MQTTLSFLDRMLEPVTEVLTPEVAQRIVDLRADSELQEYIEGLRAKSSTGTLSEEESTEYREFVEALDVLSILQIKARRVLREATP